MAGSPSWLSVWPRVHLVAGGVQAHPPQEQLLLDRLHRVSLNHEQARGLQEAAPSFAGSARLVPQPWSAALGPSCSAFCQMEVKLQLLAARAALLRCGFTGMRGPAWLWIHGDAWLRCHSERLPRGGRRRMRGRRGQLA